MTLSHLQEAIGLEAMWQWAAPGLLAQGAPLDRQAFLNGRMPAVVLVHQVLTAMRNGMEIGFMINQQPPPLHQRNGIKTR